jgi:helix-turn-helix protein
MVDEDQPVSEKVAARFLGVSERSLQRWRIDKCGPPYIRYGKHCIRYRPSDLRTWREAQIVLPEVEPS